MTRKSGIVTERILKRWLVDSVRNRKLHQGRRRNQLDRSGWPLPLPVSAMFAHAWLAMRCRSSMLNFVWVVMN